MAVKDLVLEDVRLIYRNFEGRKGKYNKEGERSVTLIIPENRVEGLLQEGWKVKPMPVREEGDEVRYSLEVNVRFDFFPPRLWLVSSRGKTSLDESSCQMLDWAEIEKADVILRPYEWEHDGNSGIKAYLKTLYVTIEETALDRKYADLPSATVSRTQYLEDGEE